MYWVVDKNSVRYTDLVFDAAEEVSLGVVNREIFSDEPAITPDNLCSLEDRFFD